MFESTFHRRVAFAALVALTVLSGTVASATVVATADVSPSEVDRSPAPMAETTTADENVSAKFVYEGDRIVLHSDENQTVHLKTNAEPDTELTVELRVDGNFVVVVPAPVSENGTATAALDMRRFDPGTEFVVVGPDGIRTDGEIVEASSGTTTAATTYNESGFWSTTAATTTATDEPTGDVDTSDRNDSNDGLVPGFGVPAAVAALLAAFALVGRANR